MNVGGKEGATYPPLPSNVQTPGFVKSGHRFWIKVREDKRLLFVVHEYVTVAVQWADYSTSSPPQPHVPYLAASRRIPSRFANRKRRGSNAAGTYD
jgi:hypothetical protein